MVQFKLPIAKITFNQACDHISPDNLVHVLEREYAITTADDKRPVLMTQGIFGFGVEGCIGMLFYDPTSKVRSLTHLFHNHRFSQTVNEIIEHMARYSGRKYQGFIIRPRENIEIAYQIKQTQEKLQMNNTLIGQFELILEQTVIFDTRIGEFYIRPPHLYLPAPEERPYGNIPKDIPALKDLGIMSCCYEPSQALIHPTS